MKDTTRGVRFALRLTESEYRAWQAVQRALELASVSETVRRVMQDKATSVGQPRKNGKKR